MSQDIAIIGIGCRFPGGSASPESYWTFLQRGGDAVGPLPQSRWSDLHYDADPSSPGRSYVRHGGYLEDPALHFDASFFGISPREAESLDPQQRLLLEVAWEALEDAGVPVEQARAAKAGVFVGGFTLDSMILRFRDLEAIDNHTATSSSMTLLSNRISYTLDLQGPSLTVDTACSSSLVATHLAAQALAAGECGLALAGGVNLMLLPNFQIVMCKGRFLAADGRSKTFDADADGYGRGEGAGIVVLKRLADAQRDGDRIYAVISGSGVNQDGATDGIAQPSAAAQEALIRAVCSRFSLDPSAVGYVEAHGTGTALGDPVEVSALGRVYGRAGQADAPRIGSVKANMGHLEAAAGVAGLIKAALAVAHRQVPPHRRPRQLNPALNLDRWGLRLPLSPEPWPRNGPAVAVVNSFGYGGTNAHAVLREAPVAPTPAGGPPPLLLPLSARSPEALSTRAGQILMLLSQGASLADLASTLAWHRSALPVRAAIPCGNPEQMRSALQQLQTHPTPPAEPLQRQVWVYSGMGPQWAGMGRELAERPAFREGWEQATAALARHGVDVRHSLSAPPDQVAMHRNDVAQPCNFALQVGLTTELRAQGLTPDAILGHSTGEMAAAWAAGALSLEEAAKVVAVRARLQQRVAGGGMLAVGLGEAEVGRALEAFGGRLEIGAINAPTSVTVAGDVEGLEALAASLSARGVFARRIRGEVAYHSAHMDPIEAELRAELADLQPQMPTTPLWSTVSGSRVHSALHDADYWWRNTRGAVRLADAVRSLSADGPAHYLQVGPHPVLAPALAEVAGPQSRPVALLTRGEPEIPGFVQALGRLWEAGIPLRWALLAPRAGRLSLPAYPWQRRRYWRPVEAPPAHPLLVERADSPDPSWTARVDGARWAWLRDHQVGGAAVIPGALWLEAMLAAAQQGRDESGAVLTDVRFFAALVLGNPGEIQELRSSLAGDRVQVHARTAAGGTQENWRLHAEARVQPAARWAPPTALDAAALEARCPTSVSVDSLYHNLDQRGLCYGPAFRGIRGLQRGDSDVLAEVTTTSSLPFYVNPAQLDAAFQALLALRPDDPHTLMPVGIGRVQLLQPPAPGPWKVHGHIREDQGDHIVGDLHFRDAEGRVFLAILGLRCQRLAREVLPERWWHQPRWEAAAPENPSAGTLWRVPVVNTTEVSDLVKELLHRVRAGTKDLVVVTQNAWSVGGFPAQNPAHAALWGTGRVVMTEQPQLRLRLLDVDEDQPDDRLLSAIGSEEEAALRGGQRYVARLHRARTDGLPPEGQRGAAGQTPARLVAAAGGSLDGLHFVAAPREAPEAGVLEVEIEAASLNFKDVMKAMGLLDADALEQSYLGSALGMEAVGRVLRGGPGTTLAAGTRVLLYSGGCIRTHALVPENFVLACPEDWTVEQAASFFVTATAWHALVDVGRVRAGETVLIHSAAGGVGLAAVGIARAFGLRVIATAGTERKRAWLREQGLEWVLDSRTLDFAEEARRITGGRGVDVVLNALAGPAIEQGLRALAPGGRFLELGKKDLADHRSLMMGAFNRRLTFSAIDLDRAATEDPGYFRPLARQVIDAFLDGRLSHLPARLFPADEVVPAFRALASGDWIGKVVIGMRQGALTVFPDRCSTFRPRPRRSWLVTGGLGGFGLALAGMLVRAGVSRVLLCGRRGVVEEEGALAALQQRAEVEVVALDVTDAEAVARLVQRLQEGDVPLGGVIHAANAYADQPLSELTPATLERALGAKAHGAWNLHLATSALDLEGFVLCSSISAQVGNPGQGAYAAANCFLDGLAELRRATGLPGTSVALGAIGDTGLVARDQGTAVHLRSLGLVPMPAERLAEAVGVAIAEGRGRVGLVDIDWDRWMEAHPETPWKRLTALKERENRSSQAGFREQLAALPEGERVGAALEALREASAPVFRMEAAALDGRRPLRDQGLDSLMAVELSAALRSKLRLDISAMDLLGGRSLAALAERLVGQAPAPVEPAAVTPPGPQATAGAWTAERLRASICVTTPYEALEELRQEGEELWAEVSPVILGDEGPISTAELGRHLAILGSMAVATLHPDAGQHAYPVHTAEIELAEEDGPPVDRVRLRARGLSCDPQRRSGRAETELFDRGGRRLGAMRVGYHVMPMSSFRALFSEKARPTPVGPDPYRQQELPRLVEQGEQRLVMELGPVQAEHCQGHFDGLPALPVSILGRQVFAAVAAAAKTFDGLLRPRLRRARLITHRFIWAGETARLEAGRISGGWSCEVRVGPELCARFELELVG